MGARGAEWGAGKDQEKGRCEGLGWRQTDLGCWPGTQRRQPSPRNYWTALLLESAAARLERGGGGGGRRTGGGARGPGEG